MVTHDSPELSNHKGDGWIAPQFTGIVCTYTSPHGVTWEEVPHVSAEKETGFPKRAFTWVMTICHLASAAGVAIFRQSVDGHQG